MKRALLIVGVSLLLNLPSLAVAKEFEVLTAEQLAEVKLITQRADSFLARKFYEDAILEYNKALLINPYDAVLHNKLGIAYHQTLNLDMAKKEYERARKINPCYSEAWNNLGTVYYSLKRYKQAVKNYQKSLRIQPQSATAYHNMGAAYFAMKKYEEGFNAYMLAYRLDPGILERISTSGTVIKTTELNQAVQSFYLAKLFAVNGELEKALAYLLKALENGFSDFDKITKDPDFKTLVQDERLVRLMGNRSTSF